MKSFFKWLSIAIGALVILVVAAVVVLPMFFDPNDFRDDMVAQVKERTGRDLVIDGDIKLSVFPWLGVDVGPMKLGNAPGFDEPVFASTENVNVRVKLMPLLSRTIEADTVVVKGVVLNLERDAKGQSNWDDLAGKGGGDGSKPAQSGSSGGGQAAEGPGLAGLAIGGLSIEDARISWKDRQSGQDLSLDNVRLKTGKVEAGKPVDIEAGLELAASAGVAASIVATSTLTVDVQGPTANLSPLKVDAALSGKAIPGEKADLSLNAKAVNYDGKAQELAIEALQVALQDLALNGQLKVTGLGGKPAYSGTFDVAEFSLRGLMETLGIKPPVTADPKVLDKVSLSTQVNGTPQSVALSNLKVKLDDSSLTGKFAVNSFAGPVLRFDLGLDAIDADRYLPPPAEGAGVSASDNSGAGGGSGSGGAGAKPDFTALRKLDADGQVKVGKLKIKNLKTEKIAAKLNAKGGLVKLSPVSASLYQGTYAGNLVLDARKDVPGISINETVKGVQAEPLLKDLNGESKLAGTANLTAKMTTRGLDEKTAKSNLNGNAAFSFTEGALIGVNVARLIREAKAKLRGQSLPPEEGELKTDFSEMSGSLSFKNGLGTNKDFQAKLPLLRIGGAGTANLVSEALDYKVNVTVVGTSKGQGGKELDDLKGVKLPLKVSGTFGEPKYGLDVSALGEELAKSKAQELLKGGKAKDLLKGDKTKAVESVKEKLKDKDAVKGLLKGVLGN